MRLFIYSIILVLLMVFTVKTQGIKRAVFALVFAYLLGLGIYTFAVI